MLCTKIGWLVNPLVAFEKHVLGGSSLRFYKQFD